MNLEVANVLGKGSCPRHEMIFNQYVLPLPTNKVRKIWCQHGYYRKSNHDSKLDCDNFGTLTQFSPDYRNGSASDT